MSPIGHLVQGSVPDVGFASAPCANSRFAKLAEHGAFVLRDRTARIRNASWCGRLIISWRDGPEASMAYLIPNPPRETRHATHAGLLLDNSAASLDAIFGRDTFRSHREKPHHWFLVQHV